MFLTDACDRKIRPRNSGDQRPLREACFNLGDAKVEKDIVTFNEEEDGDTLVEEVPQIELGTVFLRDTYRHVGFWYRNIRDKRIPREAFFDLGDVKVENVIVTFNSMKKRMNTHSWRKDLKLNAARCFTGTHANVRFTQETFVTSDSRVKRDLIWAMSKWIKTL